MLSVYFDSAPLFIGIFNKLFYRLSKKKKRKKKFLFFTVQSSNFDLNVNNILKISKYKLLKAIAIMLMQAFGGATEILLIKKKTSTDKYEKTLQTKSVSKKIDLTIKKKTRLGSSRSDYIFLYKKTI